ncbi:hypothetical protein BCR34DRAFT_572521 [Clohesyomyces aquaticus]|uniref:Uncharacterized protein n=1 Tax=Clohesyomyces aquaticus TaxID=1231657 RepID=A0A1Y1Z3W9_9PLEO|nr:hypothetical protein BCR34DRAFT_572521 [Clohesyomyces aquaticus]
MARLASGQHPEGPGDAPKRRPRGRQSRNSVDNTAKSSKRPASPPPETPANQKRARREQVDDHEQLDRELQDSVSRPQEQFDTITAHVSRSRRNSEPPAQAVADDEADGESTPPAATQPLPGLTPHLERVGARRTSKTTRHARMSMPAQLSHVDEEAVTADGTVEYQYAPLREVLDKRVTRRLRRSHLSEEVNEFEEHKKDDAKRRQEIKELRRQLREKEQRIEELEYQSEAQRLGNIDMSEDQSRLLEKELENARQEIEEMRKSSVYAASEPMDHDDMDMVDDDINDDGLLLVNPEDLGITPDQFEPEPHANGFYATRASQMTVQSFTSTQRLDYDFLAQSSQTDVVPDRVSDRAVKRYKEEIASLTTQVANVQHMFRELTVDLQNLSILVPGATVAEIISSLRDICNDARESLEEIFPNSTLGLTNGEVLRKVVEHIRGLMAELRDRIAVAENHSRNETTLRVELNAILSKLAESEARAEALERQGHTLDKHNEKLTRENVDLEERVVDLSKNLEFLEDTIVEKETKNVALQDELEDRQIRNSRLSEALTKYTQELSDREKTITRLEEKHAQRMQSKDLEIQGLQQELGEQTDARAAAEASSEQKSDYITEMEARVSDLQTELDSLVDGINLLRQRIEDETSAKEAAETDRDANAGTIEQVNEQIESEIAKSHALQEQLDEMRQNLATEREQREATEATLDQRNEEIDDLNARIHDAGVASNELRSKLFENQQQKDQAIAALKQERKDMEKAHEEELGIETSRRKDAEKELASAEKQITTLQRDLTKTEDSLTAMELSRESLETERDTEVAKLRRDLDNLHKNFTALDSRSKTTIVSLESTIIDGNNALDALKSENERLKNVLAATEVEHENEIARRDENIRVLENDLSTERFDNVELRRMNKSLQERVESEATEMLNIMNANAERADHLEATIATQKATIDNLVMAAAQRDEEHAEIIEEKRLEIETLETTGQNHVGTIEALKAQIEEMTRVFATAKEDNDNIISTLNENLRNTMKQNEELAAAVQKRNADALAAVKEMKTKGLEVKTNGANLHRVSNGKVTKVAEKTKVSKKKTARKATHMRDSGYVFELEFEEDVEAV